MTPRVVLTLAGTDSSGGAGLAADLTTFAALGVHGTCVVTAVTAQDTLGVRALHPVPLGIVAAQLDAVLEDLDPAVVKTGMLGTPEVVRLVAERCAGRPLVVDPVLATTTGTTLADEATRRAYHDHLLPVATAITPNEDEHRAFGRPDHPGLVLTRGGDVLTLNDHGTGCTFAAALAAHLAHGLELRAAASAASSYVAAQLRLGRDWSLGRGRGPVAHIQPHHPGDRA